MAGACPAESRPIIGMTGATLLRHPMTQPFLRFLCEDGTPWRFGTEEPEEFLGRLGWTERGPEQPGGPGAVEGRRPYAVPLHGVGGCPGTG